MPSRTQKLKEAGQSLWLDNIQRRELHDGTLMRMIEADGICGVTSNPTIFMNAVSKSTDYDEQIRAYQSRDTPPQRFIITSPWKTSVTLQGFCFPYFKKQTSLTALSPLS